MFAAGQKQASLNGSPLSFIVLASAICLLLSLIVVPGFGNTRYIFTLQANWQWVLLSGAGLFMTYLGFNLLYSNFGTSSYILYAVLSIVTTSLIAGVIVFKETFNFFHWASMFTALLTIVLFSLGNKFS